MHAFRSLSTALLILFLWAPFGHAQATSVYQTSDDFISQAFNAATPKAKVYWLEDKDKKVIEQILSHKFNKMRIRYWQQANETVWIMDEIGKESPITVGIHIKQQAIVKTKVLVYRESRGDEVRHDFFTDQFKMARLTQDQQLDRHIDGITGATLSVRALTKLSRIALYLDSKIDA
ncbi:FMN-binding protein [Shewanella mesophila]|uniref:FMN-binding protein n=1 Tax=Shewanella mesophila TaxID=2864208 RepID=UPI001C661A5C|nr:FMN-binding protein [Shewanella mesophila]QYJ85626.1 FMN-binding protein [Shewanella mesophila]